MKKPFVYWIIQGIQNELKQVGRIIHEQYYYFCGTHEQSILIGQVLFNLGISPLYYFQILLTNIKKLKKIKILIISDVDYIKVIN